MLQGIQLTEVPSLLAVTEHNSGYFSWKWEVSKLLHTCIFLLNMSKRCRH